MHSYSHYEFVRQLSNVLYISRSTSSKIVLFEILFGKFLDSRDTSTASPYFSKRKTEFLVGEAGLLG